MEIDHTITGCEQSRRDQLLLQEELSEQNRHLRGAHIKRLHEMEELSSVQESRVREIPSHSSESEQIRILLERQREQILADRQAEIRKHELQADYDRRSIQKLNGMIESQKEEICRAHQGDERLRRDQQLVHDQVMEQDRDLCQAHMKSLDEMEELKRVQFKGQKSMNFREED